MSHERRLGHPAVTRGDTVPLRLCIGVCVRAHAGSQSPSSPPLCLAPQVGAVLCRALRGAGIATFADLLDSTDEELQSLAAANPKQLQISKLRRLRKVCAAQIRLAIKHAIVATIRLELHPSPPPSPRQRRQNAATA